MHARLSGVGTPRLDSDSTHDPKGTRDREGLAITVRGKARRYLGILISIPRRCDDPTAMHLLLHASR